jgi:hypothetical protein
MRNIIGGPIASAPIMLRPFIPQPHYISTAHHALLFRLGLQEASFAWAPVLGPVPDDGPRDRMVIERTPDSSGQ